MRSIASSPWSSSVIVIAIVLAGAVLSGLHDAIPTWFEILAAGALGHTITASGVTIGQSPTSGGTTSTSPPPPPPSAGGH